MSNDVQELYQQTVRLLPAQEQLQLAALILAEIALPKRTPLSERERKDALDQLLRHAGAVSSGNQRSADNEQIDIDLAREYGKDI
jgi:hypothetical protein